MFNGVQWRMNKGQGKFLMILAFYFARREKQRAIVKVVLSLFFKSGELLGLITPFLKAADSVGFA